MPETMDISPRNNHRVTFISALLVVLFLLLFAVDRGLFNHLIDTSYVWSAQHFGWFWQIFMLANFGVAMFALTRRGAGRKLGQRSEPEFPAFQWVAMVLCTLLAGGGVFWAAAEPIAHLVSPPPVFPEAAPLSNQAIDQALAQSFLHWGFLAWSVLGSLAAIILMHLHYERGLPLAPRSLLYPLTGEGGVKGWMGDLADIVSALAVFAGTVGPIGFLGLQISYGLSEFIGTRDHLPMQLGTIACLMAVYLTSAVSGMHKGIQILSRLNIVLGLLVLAFLFLAGPTQFILEHFGGALLTHLAWLPQQALFRGDEAWLSAWTVFFWGWFIGYGPMMAIFIARISRGRSAREIILLMSVVAPLLTMAWFSIIGGTGLGLEAANPGTITAPFEGFNLPAVLLAITGALPFNTVVTLAFLVLTALFVATTGDSMTYSLSVVSSGTDHPPRWLRLFWGLTMGVTAMVLISGSAGGIGKLQSFIVVTAVPVSLLLVPSLWGVFKAIKPPSD